LCFTGSGALVFDKLKTMLKHQPAVLVQPHSPELFAREFRLVMNAETGRVCVSLMTERRPGGMVTVTDLRPGTEQFEAAAALLPALQRCAQLTHALICSKVPMFSTRVGLYRIDLAVLNEASDHKKVIVANEVQCSYDTSLFPEDHTWPVMDLQALQTEKILLNMVFSAAAQTALFLYMYRVQGAGQPFCLFQTVCTDLLELCAVGLRFQEAWHEAEPRGRRAKAVCEAYQKPGCGRHLRGRLMFP
jgi:hypothetical protein